MDYVVVGHVSRDVQPDGGYVLGGTVLYTALTALNLGCKVGLFTRAADDPELAARLQAALPGVEVLRQPSPSTTSFENVYTDGHRQQYVRSYAFPLNLRLLPASWRQASVLHLAPIAREIDEGEAITLLRQRSATAGLVSGLTPQGWLREWRDDGGKVFFRPWPEAAEVMPLTNAVIFSEEDVAAQPELAAEYCRLSPLAVLTEGARGANLYQHGVLTAHQPAFPTTQVEPTGAGDVFAASFMVVLQATGDPRRALTIACAAASFAVEQRGLAGVPTAEQVRWRLRQHGIEDWF